MIPVHGSRPAGLEAIIIYKLVKAGVTTILGILAVVLIVRGAEAAAATLAEVLLEWTQRAWALKAATLLVVSATSGHIKWAAALAFTDSVLSAIEGLALRAGKWWAPWLVVVATSVLLPWEVIEVLLHPGWFRVLILIINLAVVLYLLRGVIREHRQTEAALHPPPRG